MTRPLEQVINAMCEKRLGRVPDLDNPRGFNDLIQWLKLHDQRREQITLCDKLAVRDYVTERAGDSFLVPIRRKGEFPFIAKCAHDSGSAIRVAHDGEWQRASARLMPRLQRPYGVEKGEWAYQFVPPRIICERLLPGDPPDYKFQCSHGQVRWVRVVRGRAQGKPKETILAPDGSLLRMHMDQKMIPCHDPDAYPGDQAWRAMSDLALALADGWRCIRVDLYWAMGQPWFGETTFWPMAGCYLTADEPRFGPMLELDLTEKLEPIVR